MAEHNELIAIHVRSVRGPGGQTEGHSADTYRRTYPSNPTIPQPVIVTFNYNLPSYMGNDALPPELAADVPTLATHNFVLGSPFSVPYVGNGYDGPYGYDVYSFGASSGFSNRQQKSFSYSVPDPASFSLNFSADATMVDVQFINEEYPGIWEVSLHATGPSSQEFFGGLLMMKNAPAFGGFSVANLPGSYTVDLNEQICGGPYGTLGALGNLSFICTPPFGWTFNASGVTDRFDTPGWGVWQLPGGMDSGRLLFSKTPSGSPLITKQIRGWELVRSDGANDMWILENVTVNPNSSTSAPPVSFIPTGRLSHVTKQP